MTERRILPFAPTFIRIRLLFSETVSDTEDAELSVAQKSSPTAAPSPRQRREASRQSTIPGRRERENATRNVARRDGTGSSAPVLPDGLQGESDRSEPIDGGPVSAFLRPDSGNQFAPGFDSEFQRVVESVIRETDSPRPETKPSTRVMSGAGDVRGPVLAPQLPDHATGDNQETLLSGNDVGQLIDRSRRNMATTLAVPTERQESPQIHSHPGQPQRPVSLTDGTAPVAWRWASGDACADFRRRLRIVDVQAPAAPARSATRVLDRSFSAAACRATQSIWWASSSSSRFQWRTDPLRSE